MVIDSIGPDAIREVAAAVFGRNAEVSCMREIAPSKSHGITETPPSTRNLLFVVDLVGHEHSYVFRFSRVEDDVYEQEACNYRLIAEQTGVCVPTIYGLDTSGDLVPTSYMVMDYLPGKLWNYAAHPSNPNTGLTDRTAIGEAVGGFYAAVHDITTEPETPDAEKQTILYTIDRLEMAAERGNVAATARDIDRCRRAVLEEPAFTTDQLSLCLADTEIHVLKKQSSWDISFICDAEWVEYRHPFSDLTQMLSGARPWWRLAVPAPHLDPESVAEQPFFRGYDPDRRLDYESLLRLAAHYQLGLWAYVAMTAESPEKRAWVRETHGPLIRELIRLVSERAAPAGRSLTPAT